MKAQAALEYMMIVGLAMLFIIPVWAFIADSQQKTSAEMSLTYGRNAVKLITDTADVIYSQGPPAKFDIAVYIPKNVREITFNGSTIIFYMETEIGTNDVASTSNAILNGSLPTGEGNYWVTIEAADNIVNIYVAP